MRLTQFLLWRQLLWLAVSLTVVLSLASSSSAAAISQGYRATETNIVPGMLVSLVKDNSTAVQAANTERTDGLLGVAVAANNSLLELASGGNEVQVVTGGVAPAIVSDINGQIKAGDKITASPLNGVGMKALVTGRIVGVAQADFDTSRASRRSVSGRDGKPHDVLVEQLPIQVGVSSYVPPESVNSLVPGFLQTLANTVAGRQVSPVRIIASALLLLIALLAVAVLLYSTARSSIISIGRNPLSEPAVRKSLFQVMGVVVAILLVTFIAIYFILTR
jgi:hypothetical protein